MPQCSFYGCKITEKSVPRLQWKARSFRDNFQPTSSSRVCSKHFLPSDFNQSDILKYRLLGDSVKKIIRLNPGTVPTRCLKSKDDESESSHVPNVRLKYLPK